MNRQRRVFRGRWQVLPCLVVLALFGLGTLSTGPASANHPVLVEGNCDSPVPGTTLVSPGTCGDFDGDGRIGTAEDTDGADRIFGTIMAAVGPGTGAAAGTGANFNGTVTIVKSGRFAEQVHIVNPGGHIEIAGAPGVEAIIDAVFQGDPAGGNNARQETVGILFSTPADRRVILRNLTIRNWAEGLRAVQAARITVIGCRFEYNRDFGIRVADSSRVAVYNSQIVGTGFRVGSANNATPFGHGVLFETNGGGTIANSLITGNLRNAVLNVSALGAPGVNYYEVITESNGTDGVPNATRITNP
jgi:Right handed beta helix region